MDDRELLERAAKAAGLPVQWVPYRCVLVRLDRSEYVSGEARYPSWNPLADDGDALRLLARLRLVLNVSDGSAHAWKWNPGSMEPFSVHRGDEMAAVRRAIVQEAATLAPKS